MNFIAVSESTPGPFRHQHCHLYRQQDRRCFRCCLYHSGRCTALICYHSDHCKMLCGISKQSHRSWMYVRVKTRRDGADCRLCDLCRQNSLFSFRNHHKRVFFPFFLCRTCHLRFVLLFLISSPSPHSDYLPVRGAWHCRRLSDSISKKFPRTV